MKLGILLTGTIRPMVVGGNFSIQERMDMYSSTLRYYSKVLGKDYPIVFVENSDIDITGWISDFNDSLNLEILQFSPTDEKKYEGFNTSLGKGYNEYLMIKKGILASEFLRGCTHFLKITGRYSMLNIKNIIKEAEMRIGNKNIVFMGDIKDTCIYDLIGRKNTCSSHWGDSRFFVASLDFYKNEMIDCYKEMNDYKENQWAEHYFLRLSRIYRKDSRFIFRFRHQVQFNGVSGTVSSEDLLLGIGNQNSLRAKINNKIRGLLRLLFPNIWF